VSSCRATLAFLTGLRDRAPPEGYSPSDLSTLQKLGLVQILSAAEFAQVQLDVQGLDSARDAILRDGAEQAQRAAELQRQSHRTHSILFRLEGTAHQAADRDLEAKDASDLQAVHADLRAKEQAFAELSAKRSLLDFLSPYAGGYAALTGLGAIATRDLSVALYRVSDDDFATYWTAAQHVELELDGWANESAGYMSGLVGALPKVEAAYLWAIAVGLAKSPGDPRTLLPNFVDAYGKIGGLAHNDENRLMSAEILSTLGRPVDASLPDLAALDRFAGKAGVPPPSSLGVASILLMGQRRDGSFATDNLTFYLKQTRSFEAAALLAVVNVPVDELMGKFSAAAGLYRSWGYEDSEDVQLSSAYLAVSDLPIDGVSAKIAILANGLRQYLQYPLVGASILAAIPVLEANETLSLLEKAYETIGRRTGPMAPPELICLAIRMLHGIQVASVDALDATAAAVPTPSGTSGLMYGSPRFFFVPLIVAHGYYYSTFSGMGGVHPGHVHGFGGFSG
jgi:hypothetical protein